MFKILIHLLGGYTSSEYNQLSVENTSLTEQITTLTSKNKDLQTQVDNLNKIKDSFVIKVDGGKVWIENE